MKDYLFIEKPTLKKGQKIVSLVLLDNKGNIVHTEWSNTYEDKELKRLIKENKNLLKEIDKKLDNL